MSGLEYTCPKYQVLLLSSGKMLGSFTTPLHLSPSCWDDKRTLFIQPGDLLRRWCNCECWKWDSI